MPAIRPSSPASAIQMPNAPADAVILGPGAAGPVVPVVPLLARVSPVERPARTWSCHALAGVDDRGRVGDTAARRALTWPAGTAVGFVRLPGVDAVLVRRGGCGRIAAGGRLRLPVPVRRLLNVRVRDRVPLGADPQRQTLVVCTMAALDVMTIVVLAAALQLVVAS